MILNSLFYNFIFFTIFVEPFSQNFHDKKQK